MFFAKDINLILHIINMKKNFYITALHNGHLELRESSQVTCDNAIQLSTRQTPFDFNSREDQARRIFLWL